MFSLNEVRIPIVWLSTTDAAGFDRIARAGDEVVGRVQRSTHAAPTSFWRWWLLACQPLTGLPGADWALDGIAVSEPAAIECVRRGWLRECIRRQRMRAILLADATHASPHAAGVLSRHVRDPAILEGLQRAQVAWLMRRTGRA